MSSSAPRRDPYPHADPSARHLLALLLAQDGSTTRLCEAVAGGPVELHVVSQRVVDEAPAGVRAHLGGGRCIERITFLAAHGQVLMDNLAYVALAGLEPDIEADLVAQRLPIGHLLARWWTRRAAVDGAARLAQRLWQAVGTPDAAATRVYRIDTPQGARMVIAETYRRGFLDHRATAA